MEVVLLGSEGLPEGAVLSLKWGDMKRQAPVSQTGQHFRFNDSAAHPMQMKVEVLTPMAPAQSVPIDPAQDVFEVAFDSSMKVRLQHRATAENQRQVVDIKSGDSKGPAERLHMAQQAASYLEEHDLVKTFQEILHGLIVTKPADPHLYVEAHLAKARKLAQGADARVLCSAGETDRASAGSATGTELYKAKRRRSSVREHMRSNQRNAVGCSKVEALLLTLESASNNLELVLHLVPDTLRESISNAKFVQLCENEFRALDKEQRGELTSDDLLDVIVELSRAQKDSISQVQCRKFAEMFDTDQDGLINIAEFTQMVQFVTVASWLESEEGKYMIQKASLAERTFQDFIKMIEADKERLWSIIPFLPEGLVNHLTGEEFEKACFEQFDALDVDRSGTLEPMELLPVIQLICQTQEHAMQMTEEKCRRFTSLFDTDGNGVIQRDEFIEFAQFLTVMNFLTNTEEGQSVNQKAQAVVNESLKTDALWDMLEQDPDLLPEVLPHLPKPLYWELTSLEFNKACMDGFQAAAGPNSDLSTTVQPGMLTNVVYQLMQGHPFMISEEQCNHYISRWDKDLKNSVTSAEFLLLARYIIVMGFLNYQLQNQDTLVADSMLGSEKMETLLAALKKGSEMVWEILPFLPEALVDELSSDTFEQTCLNFFTQLDKDSNGTLEPLELLPVVQELTQAHSFVLTEDHCKRFVDIFDIDRNGVIARDEFVNFVRYMMIMSFMETPEGQRAKVEAEADMSSLAVDSLLKQLARDRQAIFKVLGLLPEAVYSELISQKFVKDFNDEFRSLDKDGSGVLEPVELFPVIVRLSQSKPFAVTHEQCQDFTKIFDLHGDGVIRADEFLDFGRFLFIIGYLHSEDGKAAATEAVKVLEDSRRIEDLLEALERDRAAVQQVMPYLPQWLRNDLLSERFVTECITIFEELDKDKNGTLEPEELFPMVRNMADAHSMALDLDQCKRFSSIFDDNGDGLIELDEFVNFSRFMIVMAFLHSQEGQLTLSLAMEPNAVAQMNGMGSSAGGVPPGTPQEMLVDAMVSPMIEEGPASPTSPAHLAVDCEFYRKKSDKLIEENDSMRERLRALEEAVRTLQGICEEQDQKLRHAEVDLRASGLR